MPEDRTTQTGSASASDSEQAAPPIVHEDIMQRLLEYQRKLREGLSPQEAARAVAERVASEGAPPTEQAEQAEQKAELHAEPVITATEPEPVVDLTAAEAELEQRAAQEAPPAGSETEEPVEQEVEPAEAEAPAREAAAGTAPVDAPAEAASEPAIAPASPEPAEAAAPASGSVWAVPAPSPDPELVARVEQLERTLAAVSEQVSELRQRFQDMAIAADERLAELERTLSRVGREER
jgi:hypothetical protein